MTIDASNTTVSHSTEDPNLTATRNSLAGAISTLRQWAAEADAHTVTQGNAVATLQTVVDNLAIFYARFADLLEMQYR